MHTACVHCTPDHHPPEELTREDQLALEQPGCVHATMDLFKLAMKLAPFVESSLVADCFDLARQVGRYEHEHEQESARACDEDAVKMMVLTYPSPPRSPRPV